jgi:hypothetical protein
VGILTLYFLGKIFPRIRKFQHIFVNFRAFGHSISDTNAFLSTFPNNGLCISIGNSFERNPFMPSLYGGNNLIQLIFPKPKWIGKTNLRKIAGPFFANSLKCLQKIGFISNATNIYSENQQVVLECLRQRALVQFHLSESLAQKILNYIQSVDKGAREHSKTIGTWAQIYDPEIIGNGKQENLMDKFFLREIENRGVDTDKLVTLILRVGGSPHHGPGLSHYLPVIEFLQARGYSIIPLGDTAEFENNRDLDRSSIIFPHDINVQRRSIDFSSILYSKFTLGDMSGLWPIFTMRGTRGLCLNTIPSKFLMNRVEVLPRIWENEKGMALSLSQQFGPFGETVRGLNRELEINGYKPRFHDPKTILECVRRFESEAIQGTPLKIQEPFLKYFAEYPQKMLSNCSIAREILN